MDKKVISQYRTIGTTLNITRMREIDDELAVVNPVARALAVVELAIEICVVLIVQEVVVEALHVARLHGSPCSKLLCAIACLSKLQSS